MRMFRVLSYFVLLPLLGHSQESPTIFATKFDSSVSYRTNVCDRQRDVWDNRRILPDALRGLNLTAVITNYIEPDEDKYFTLVDGKIKEHDPGLFAVILDEVARRAGFSWRNSFGVTSPVTAEDGNKTWTDLLEANVKTFDISMEKWGRSIGRLEKGISFPAGWWDSSIVLVERVEEQERVVNLWSFLSPFQSSVWATIFGTIIFTGVLYWFLEYLDTDADERNLEDSVWGAMFYSFLVFAGHMEFRPNTDAARIVTWSWTFWAVIVGSAYTANMASFLVSPQVDVYRIGTMEEAIRLNATICVQRNGVLSTILETKYGKLNLVPKDTESGIFLGLHDGSCQVAAHQVNTFRIYEKNLEANYDCTLESEMRVVQPVAAGMATAIDTGVEYCTTLISHVLDFHLTEMIADGFVEKAWKTHLSKVSTIECIKEPQRRGDFGDETFSLGMQDIGGIFILHGIVLVLSISIALFQFYYFGTSQKSLSEILFIKQGKAEIGRRRESIRRSIWAHDDGDLSPNVAPRPSNAATFNLDCHDLELTSEELYIQEEQKSSTRSSKQLDPVDEDSSGDSAFLDAQQDEIK